MIVPTRVGNVAPPRVLAGTAPTPAELVRRLRDDRAERLADEILAALSDDVPAPSARGGAR